MFNRMNIDPSKVNNPFALASVFLLASEGLLGFWFSKASDTNERIVVGSLMTLILICSLFLIYKLTVASKPQNATPTAFDQKVTPGSKEVSVEEIKVISAEKISGPGGTYTIEAPPPAWKTKITSLTGMIIENLDIKDHTVINNLLGISATGPENILLLKSNSIIEVIPLPGKTIINEILIPTALLTKLPIQLAIIPLERLQPPFYAENSFEHNVYNFIGQTLKSGLIKMQSQFSGKIKESGREFIQVEMLQVLEHIDISINDQIISDCRKVEFHMNIIAIKGDIIDHLLVMSYPSMEDKNSIPFLDNEISVLKTIISSFSPLKITDPIKMINEIKQKGKANSEINIKNAGEDMFMSEFVVVLKKINELNPNNDNDKKRIIMLLKPFKEFAELIHEKDEELQELWNLLGNAEKGDDKEFFEELKLLSNEIDEKEEDDNAVT